LFLSEAVAFDDMRMIHQYMPQAALSNSSTVTKDTTVSDMVIAALTTSSDSSLLLISGKVSSTGEEVVFGAFFPSPTQDETEIRAPESPAWERNLLFQLSPVFDVFRGYAGKSAWVHTG
jgi:hypothetical protein